MTKEEIKRINDDYDVKVSCTRMSEETKRINEEFQKSPAYAEMMSVATIKKDINGMDIICLPDDFETGYKK